MIIGKMRRQDQGGFTIAEVSIASAVFALVLLIALAVFFGISRLFYKGVSASQTQEASQQIMQNILGNFNANAGVNANLTGNGYTYHCVGNTRFVYNLNHKVDADGALDHSPGGNFGILMDTLPGNGSSCASPCNDTAPVVCDAPNVKLGKYSTVVELLGNNMRVTKFSINRDAVSYNLFNLSLIIAYGEDDTLDLTDANNPLCKNQRGSEFCAVNKINTSVFQGQGV